MLLKKLLRISKECCKRKNNLTLSFQFCPMSTGPCIHPNWAYEKNLTFQIPIRYKALQ